MPVVEKVAGSRVTVRHVGHFDIGDRKEVTAEQAEYLVDERGDFEYVDEDEGDQSEDASGETSTEDDSEEAESADESGDEDDDSTEDDVDEEEYPVDISSREDLEELGHDELKATAEQLGIAEETDLRSNDTIIDGILEHVGG